MATNTIGIPGSVKDLFFDFINKPYQEGFAARIYLDSKGIPTVGVGLALVIQGRDKTWHVRDDTP